MTASLPWRLQTRLPWRLRTHLPWRLRTRLPWRLRTHLLPLLALLACASGGAWSAASDWPMAPMSPDLNDQPSLQRGLQLYANYCLGCHSLQFQRYERTADDLGIPHDVVADELIFTGQKIGELMTTAMDPESAKAWFGGPPPDLTMVTRVRSPEWIYNYLKTFYVDDTRPFGVNNKVFENVGMPHALIDLQGVQRDACPEGVEGCRQLAIDPGSGLMTAEQYDQAAYDIANFLHYVGEPTRLVRERLGLYVLGFLAFLGIFTYLLNREFWKDVH